MNLFYLDTDKNASDSVEQQNNESEGLGVFTLKFKQKLKARGRPVGSGAGVLKFHVNKSRKKSIRVPRSRKISIVPSGDTTKAINFQDSNIEHDIDGNENSAQNTLVGDSDSEHHLCYFPPVLRGHMTFSVKEYRELKPREYVSDNLVDFV